MANHPEKPTEKLIHAYNTMMERASEAFEQAGNGVHNMQQALERAKEKAIELDELTREEADEIADYLKRDFKEAAHYLTDTGLELRDWLHLDIELIEQSLLDLISSVADKTRVELKQIEQQARQASEYHTGQITGPGSLECVECGEILHFQQTGHIPPCPKCQHSVFVRKSR
jgi:hypothetical protein